MLEHIQSVQACFPQNDILYFYYFNLICFSSPHPFFHPALKHWSDLNIVRPLVTMAMVSTLAPVASVNGSSGRGRRQPLVRSLQLRAESSSAPYSLCSRPSSLAVPPLPPPRPIKRPHLLVVVGKVRHYIVEFTYLC